MDSKEKLKTTLKKHLEGEVRDDLMTQQIYSTDASFFEITPTVVVLPKNKEDLCKTVEIAKEHHTPLTARGGATGIAGGCLGSGIIVDTSKYLRNILDFHEKESTILCEPGVIQDQLNTFASPYGLRLGPDTSTGNRSTVGGMCATNAAGSHYLKYGSMIDHVLGVELLLSNGATVWLDEHSDWPGLPEGTASPAYRRNSSGYPLHTLKERPRNLAKLTVGSEGTLGIYTRIRLKLSPMLQKRSLAVFGFSSLEESLKKVPEILSFHPISLEALDHHVLEMGRLSPSLRGRLDWLNFLEAKALLIAEFEEDQPPRIYASQYNLFNDALGRAWQDDLWTLRRAGLGLLLSRRSYSRAIAFIEDLAVPPEQLASFIKELKACIPWEMGIYGHAGDGCLHTRPYVQIDRPDEINKIFELMPLVADLVRAHGGTLSGEHGDGVVRSWLNPRLFDTTVYEQMLQVKYAFDPVNLMNPAKKVNGEHPHPYVHRSTPTNFKTFLNFEKEGGLHLAVDLCNGNGACRKTTGLMCPSYHAFKDEKHTTRARARSLAAILNGKVPAEELTNKGLLDVLDYCLQCKGCKTECPSQVDMAKMKTEVLFQYQEKKGYFLKSRLFGHYAAAAALGCSLAPFSNWALNQSLVKKLLSAMGIAPERPMPHFIKERFSAWWKKRASFKGKKTVHLFIDTFTEHHCPEVGQAAVEVLEKFDFTVAPITNLCCGRTYFSHGMLKEAKKKAHCLNTHIAGLKDPIVVLEPSCLSTINDDYPSLLTSFPKVYLMEEILPPFTSDLHFLYHPHCHEQVLFNSLPLKRIFPRMLSNESGCCGLAGSFGYQSHHYEMSMAIAENSLFPKIRAFTDLILVASGFSCRQQIAHGLQKKALHPSEIILKSL
jgi:FAD/FMN-containing dehydrogenase/Fe-S oxidoreductase